MLPDINNQLSWRHNKPREPFALTPPGLLTFLFSSWLEYVHGRITNTIQTRVTNRKRSNEERLKIAEYIKGKLSRLQDESGEIIRDLKVLLKEETDIIVRKLTENLHDENTIKRLAHHCCEQELPDLEDMEKNRFICKDLIWEAIFKEVAEWESQHRIIQKTKNDLFARFGREFAHVEYELQQVERLMQGAGSLPQTSSSGVMMEDVPEEGPTFFSRPDKLVLALFSPIWVPLAFIATAIALPIMGSLAIGDKIQHCRKVLAYLENKYKYVLQWTKQVIEVLREEDIKKAFVENHMSDLSKYIVKFESVIPKLVEADKKLIDDVEKDITATNDTLHPLLDQIHRSQGLLQLFRFRNLMNDDSDVFHDDDIDREHIVGRGRFADVWLVRLKRQNGEVERVAARVMKVELCEENAMDYALERETLINLRHENITRYIGIILNCSQHLTFLLELCKCTLADVIFKERDKNPGYQLEPGKRAAAFEFIADVAQQISRGLLYIHSKSYIHRDLKTDNVLLTEDGVVKLSDLGQAKRERDVTGTQRGTYLYVDPDILLTGLATCEADIYSLSMIMWELWFGQRVYFYLLETRTSLPHLEENIMMKNYRPAFSLKGYIPPTPDWQNLIESCWYDNPRERKNTEQVHEILCRLSHKEYLLQTGEPEVDASFPNDQATETLGPDDSAYAGQVKSSDKDTDVKSDDELSPGPISEEINYEGVVISHQ